MLLKTYCIYNLIYNLLKIKSRIFFSAYHIKPMSIAFRHLAATKSTCVDIAMMKMNSTTSTESLLPS